MYNPVGGNNFHKIKTLEKHHISEDNLPSGYSLIKKEVILLFLGLGGLNYVPVAYQNGNTVAIKIIDAITTAILGVMVLYKSGEVYYQIKIKPQYPAEALREIVEPPLTVEKFWKEFAIQFVLAAASSYPLATTLYDAHLALLENDVLFLLCFVFIMVVNTVMHLVPIEIIMRDPIYGFPRHVFLAVWRFFFPPSIKDEQDAKDREQRDKKLEAKNSILEIARKNFFNQLVCKNSTEIQTRIDRYQSNPEELLPEMLSYYAPIVPLNPSLKNIARILGALTVSMACLGYAANPYLVLRNHFGYSIGVSIGLVAIPIYFFTVLMAFFGEHIGLRVLQDLVSLKNILTGATSVQEKLPTTAKIYPYAFGVSAIGILGIIIFAGAPGREMMKLAFSDVFPAWTMIIMQGVVDLGIGVLLGFYVPFDFTKMILAYYARFRDNGLAKNIIILEAKVEALLSDFKHINPSLTDTLVNRIEASMPPSDETLVDSSFYTSGTYGLKFPNHRQGEGNATLSPLYEYKG